ncbi:MAG: DUF86 domain-containing protein [Bacteroides sp.]|nr:DUF86 domain-containing protein [Bacteroides sp.]
MREKPKDKGRLLHIKNAIDNIHEFLVGKTAEDFLTDKMLYYAVVKNMEIIGEASYMLTNDFRTAHTSVGWNDIIKMRHILVHGYYQVDPSIVWATIKNDLPNLEMHIKQYLSEFED